MALDDDGDDVPIALSPKVETKPDVKPTKKVDKKKSDKGKEKKETKSSSKKAKPADKKGKGKEVKVKAEKKVEVKRERKVYDLPGQKHEVPAERDPLRVFYESLYNQRPESEMAQFWMMEHGLLDEGEAMKVFEKKQKLLRKGAIVASPAKARSAPKSGTKSKRTPASKSKKSKSTSKKDSDKKPAKKKAKKGRLERGMGSVN